MQRGFLAQTSRRRFKFIVGSAAALALLTLAGMRVLDLRAQRAQLLKSGDRRAASLAVVFAGYLSQTFAAVDASLRQLALHSQRVGGPGASTAEWGPALVAARAALTAVGSISVTDTLGLVRHSTQPLIVGQSRRDQYIFKRLSVDTLDELVADAPFRAVTNNRMYVIPLGRRLLAPSGRFGGIVVATFLPAELHAVFRAADVGAQGMVTVFHRNGFVVLREPSTNDPIGEDARHQPLFAAAATTDTNSAYRGAATENGPVLRTAYRQLTDRHLVVAVSLSEDELLSEWRRDAIASFLIFVLLAMAIAVILSLIFREVDMRHAAEETLSRSQRLESIGRLTGGIAHDFNNLLTVILGNVAILRDGLRDGPPNATVTAESAAQIERAATRGSALVRQLLAFARRRPLQSRTVDIASIVRGAAPMLDRVLGEDVSLERRIPSGTQFRTMVDPTGVESALLNLCINARDAMVNGGTIVIELARRTLTSADAQDIADVAPGDYVAMIVRDNGSGIAPAHLPHLFEPFFTTKEVGRGTGLGLSMVYGFVKQSGGYIKVDSELGQGTTVTLYLPESLDTVPASPPRGVGVIPMGQGEVVLIVEDEPDLLTLASRVLQDLDYTVLEACDGREALRVAENAGQIDLLLTDLVMPGGMSGAQLARELSAKRPEMIVVYVSGYADHVDIGDGPPRARIVTKPYDRETIAREVQRALRERVTGVSLP